MSFFCKPVASKKRFAAFRKLSEEFSFTLFEKAAMINAQDWDSLTGGESVFLERDYLRIIEKSSHTGLICRYVIVYQKKKPCGIIYFQVVDFYAGIFGDLLSRQVESIRSRRVGIFERYLRSNKDEVLMRLFTCGNNLISGEYGFIFDDSLSKKISAELLLKITDIVAREEKLRGTISAILIKDFHEPLGPSRLLGEEKYSDFLVEPNLVVQIPDGIRSLEEYVALFSKKYRNRARSVFKNLGDLKIRELGAEDITKYERELYALYEQVFEKARFRLIKLPAGYFSSVKGRFGDVFSLKAFFMDEKIVAFSSGFLMKDSLEAHYIGIDYSLNNEFSLYQNILYLLIEQAISSGMRSVNLGRTAAEIKTTVGAKPEDLICYIKPQNAISRIIQKTFISFLQPAPMIARNPFKEEPEELLKNKG